MDTMHSDAPVTGAPPRIGSRIGGREHAAPDAPTSEVFDPGTGRVTGVVAHADAGLVDQAVAAATEAFATWRNASQSMRLKLLFAFRDLVRERREDLVEAIVAEHGKSYADAQGEMDRAIDGLEFTLALPQLLKGEYSEQVSRGIDSHSMPHPLGVAVVITPFNFPVMLPIWSGCAALACGNAVIVKPSPRVPSAALLIGELMEQAGAPAGTFTVLQGGAETVDALLDHPGIAAVNFVGSTPVAQHVYARGCAAGKRVQAMGGAKNHVVVMPDADVAFAADSLVSAAYGSTGQRCMAATMGVAVGDVADRLVAAIQERIGAVRVGPGSDRSAVMGPVVSRESQERINDLIAAGVDEGATLVVDGRELPDGLGDGFFVGPTLFDGVTPGMAIYDNEIFGPVLGITRVETLDEAIAMIDANPYGNGAAIFTASGPAARRFQREAGAGMVGINVPVPVPVNSFSTGGWKASVFGAHGLLGPEAFRFFTHQKIVTARWPQDESSRVDLAFNPGR
jgi:malonate-semialdehyde dehydrogenase (acetylating)/methylmalonate-semialdehyde dehydrogenase